MVYSGTRRAPNYSGVARPGLDFFTPQYILGYAMPCFTMGPGTLYPGAFACGLLICISGLQGSRKGLHVLLALRH